jgi:hypothetical protein
VAEDSIFSVGYDRGRSVDEKDAEQYLENPLASATAAVYSYDFNSTMVTSGGSINSFNAAAITVYPGFYPSDYEAGAWISSARAILEEEWSLWNAGVVYVDMLTREWRQFQSQICITAAIVLLLVSVMLLSPFLVLVNALTLFLPLFSCFGLAVLVYQDGILNWLGLDAVRSSNISNAFQQETVIILFSLCLAFALDYDIFLLTRIRFWRGKGGLAHRDSIIRALSETGPTISRAGIIMALAFGGNIVGDVTLFNQLAWIVCTSVLIDTFIVRPVLVPAICSLCPRLMWWPIQMNVPRGSISLPDAEDERVREPSQ